ncbi:MAG: bifunctional aspartate kinase/homoserine dehydrogenase I, partial [Candidatus Lambdaproteobacteria bacterium]|nr:bifunctional aspartate kinase/homoserine dehydrogenase I [Candidatus Lambdaproteobacteria bacterium]
MGILVQKFGGTSLGDGSRMSNVAEIIARSHERNPVVAVVSAMSSTIKSEGTTSQLLKASSLALEGKSFDEPLEKIANLHRQAITTALTSRKQQRAMRTFVEHEIERLRSFLEAIQVIRELSPRSEDILIATGERLSAHLLTATLRDRGIDSRTVDLTYAV